MRQNGLKLAFIVAISALASACGIASPEAEAEAIERELLDLPETAELFAVIKEQYPEDMAVLVEQIQQMPLAMRHSSAGEELGSQWTQDFLTRITPDAVRAPAEELIVWSATEAELFQTLQRSDKNACADMTMGSWVVIGEDNPLATAAIQRRNIAFVRAAAAGRDDPQDYGEPNQDQLNLLGDAIAATGIAPELQATLGDVPKLMALSSDQQCEVGVAYYQAISDLPDDIEPQLVAYMFAPE